MQAQGTWLGGWRLTAIIGTALVAMAGAAALLAPDPVMGVRLAIRLTARTSMVLFIAAFTAAALFRLAPSPATRWLRANRRYLGVSFAISHLVHLAAIVSLARLDYATFQYLTSPGSFIVGGSTYLFILAMLATSFDRTAAWIGPQVWRRLHITGSWYILTAFAVSFGKRVPADRLYLLPLAIIALAVLIRLLGRPARAKDHAAATQ